MPTAPAGGMAGQPVPAANNNKIKESSGGRCDPDEIQLPDCYSENPGLHPDR